MLGKLHTLVILPISLRGEYNIELIISTSPVLAAESAYRTPRGPTKANN